MLKKLFIFCFAICMFSSITRTYAQRDRSEISVGYGFYSIYSFIYKGQNYGSHYSNSSGTSVVTYRYYVSKQVTIGMGIGYENINGWGSFLSFVPELTVRYLDTRDDRVRVRLYGSVAYGVSVFDDLNVGYGSADQSGPKPWAFQATPIGVRVGRQFAYFAELGLGYKGLIHMGLEVRFPKHLRLHQSMDK